MAIRNPLAFFVQLMVFSGLGGNSMLRGQQPVGFIEKFATASDRREVLNELIPGTEDYFYYHTLHYQNEGELAAARQTLEAWRRKHGDAGRAVSMWTRQQLLEYADNPQQTLDYLRRELALQLSHASPNRDRATALPSSLEPQDLDLQRLLSEQVARDRTLNGIETSHLPRMLESPLPAEQLRAVLGRLERGDHPQLVKRIAEELSLRDSAGFGWAPVHGLLALSQLEELQRLQPELLENNNFVRAVTVRLAPPEGTLLADKKVLREYLQRLQAWTAQLPPAQNSFKALVLGNLLRLDLSEARYDRQLFLSYLQLPRVADYYEPRRLVNLATGLVQFDFAMQPQVPLPAVGDDSALVRRFLEHFLQADDNLEPFAPYLKREYLERVRAETKILYGSGSTAEWYAKLPADYQQALRERVELRFAPHNPHQFVVGEPVSLEVELKHVNQLTLRIYEINLLNYYRNSSDPAGVDIDLDGLVPNHQRQLNFTQAPERRHVQRIDFPEFTGRGTWVIDLLGGGQRSRAVVQLGRLLATERVGDAGHVFRVLNEQGEHVPTAHIELGGRHYDPDDQGRIIVPFAEQTVTRSLLLVDGQFASPQSFNHQAERYELHAGFLLEHQALLAGQTATLALRARLTCNGRPINLGLLQAAKLTIEATDLDGISTTQALESLELNDSSEFVHSFLVPQRLSRLSFKLIGLVHNRSRGIMEDVSSSHVVECNAIQRTTQIGAFFLQPTSAGYRLLVLGRNGEPLSRLPVNLAIKLTALTQPQQFTLATSTDGAIELGSLTGVQQLIVSAEGMEPEQISLQSFARHWPQRIHLARDESYTLPLGTATSDLAHFSLAEMRRGAIYQRRPDALQLAPGSLKINSLAPGDYQLHDYQSGRVVHISVADGLRQQQVLAAPHRILQASPAEQVVIQRVSVENDHAQVHIAGADEQTRVHLLARAFRSNHLPSEAAHFPHGALTSRSLPPLRSQYLDSLRLDEEYSYILDRQAAHKYPGNRLPQPSLLVHPWEVSVTENREQLAAAGDAFPPSAEPAARAPEMQRGLGRTSAAERTAWKCFDFLATGSVVLANYEVVDGRAQIPLADLQGLPDVTILVIHPLSSDSRSLVHETGQCELRDLRLRTAFDPQVHLAQVQQVHRLERGASQTLGDPRTRRLQTYTSIAEVFQLYSTLLSNSQWESFRFVTRWPELTAEQQLQHYQQHACHELNFFLYHHDRPFYDRVIKPSLNNKLDRQLIDLWLLEQPLDDYLPLWRRQRLNALERILLAGRSSDESLKRGTERWLRDFLDARPLTPAERQRRFNLALHGSALSALSEKESLFARNEASAAGIMDSPFGGGYGGGGMGGGAAAPKSKNRLDELRKTPSRSRRSAGAASEEDKAADANAYFGVDRLQRELAPQLFQTLDQTREWAESQYYRVRLAEQNVELIPANAFWQEFFQAGAQPFLPEHLELPCSSVTEALCALAVIDLPLTRQPLRLEIQDEQLQLASEGAAVVFMESVESAQPAPTDTSILVGQDLYLAQPGTDELSNKALGSSSLLNGVPYRISVVVTNPTSQVQRADLLTQLPAGSLPLSASNWTRSTPLELQPYSSAHIEYYCYFPQAGEFQHYGAQVSSNGTHLADAPAATRQVTAEPQALDESSWSYVADWGTNAQVLEFLQRGNLQRLDLSRIAFRLTDADFYQATLAVLSSSGHFDSTIWAYSVHHNDRQAIAQLLYNHPQFTSQLGPVFRSPLIDVAPQLLLSYEHLDYKPLTVARAHRLGREPVILNPSLHRQYQALLDIIAHQPRISSDHRLQLCYYLLLQNRIEETLQWFASIDASQLSTPLQYDYFDAYLDFYRGNYQRAAQIAERYLDFPVVRWSELFHKIHQQVAQRQALMTAQTTGAAASASELERVSSDVAQRILTDQRNEQQAQLASQSPLLDIVIEQGNVRVQHGNLKQVTVNYYLMDIELRFSRNPFVSQDSAQVPPIRPNFNQTLNLESPTGWLPLELPEDLRHRNVLIEVTAAGISRSAWLTASSLVTHLAEPMGQLQVLARDRQAPVVGAYVKVFARHQDGSVRFYKDGYTDLTGTFDYASLSTSDLDTTQRLAILVLDEQLGALIKEVTPPTR